MTSPSPQPNWPPAQALINEQHTRSIPLQAYASPAPTQIRDTMHLREFPPGLGEIKKESVGIILHGRMRDTDTQRHPWR